MRCVILSCVFQRKNLLDPMPFFNGHTEVYHLSPVRICMIRAGDGGAADPEGEIMKPGWAEKLKDIVRNVRNISSKVHVFDELQVMSEWEGFFEEHG